MLQKRKQNRLTSYNYSTPGYYFVTICIKDRVCCFGDIINNEIVLNSLGKIVEQQWLWLKKQYSYLDLDIYAIMPNHFHGILIIQPVGAVATAPTKVKPLSDLIGAFKTTSSKIIRKSITQNFSWQKSYYDHVIRNEESLSKIREYIKNNPKQWELDQENPKNFTSPTSQLPPP